MRQQSGERSKRRALLVTLAALTVLGGTAARGPLAQTSEPEKRTSPPASEGQAAARGLGEAGTAWEDMLLLQATRYLRLTSAQMQELLPLARTANRQLATVQAREDKALESIHRIASRQRDALISGQKPSLQEQADAILLRDGAGRSRSEAENAIVSTSLTGLTRSLTPKQVERAFLLAQGLAPEGEPKEPALLDSLSGFVTGGFDGGPMMAGPRGPAGAARRGGPNQLGNPPSLAQQLMETQAHLSMLQRTLSEGFPQGAVGGAVFSARAGQPAKVFRFGTGEPPPGVPGPGPKSLPLPPGAEVLDEAGFREHLAGEARELSGQITDLRRQLFNPQGAVAPELYESLLRPLARRLFLSPRFQQALENRLKGKE